MDWIVIVDWTPLLEAKPQFHDWLVDNGLAEESIDLTALRIDTGRGMDGDVRRYRLRADELARLGVDAARS